MSISTSKVQKEKHIPFSGAELSTLAFPTIFLRTSSFFFCSASASGSDGSSACSFSRISFSAGSISASSPAPGSDLRSGSRYCASSSVSSQNEPSIRRVLEGPGMVVVCVANLKILRRGYFDKCCSHNCEILEGAMKLLATRLIRLDFLSTLPRDVDSPTQCHQ